MECDYRLEFQIQWENWNNPANITRWCAIFRTLRTLFGYFIGSIYGAKELYLEGGIIVLVLRYTYEIPLENYFVLNIGIIVGVELGIIVDKLQGKNPRKS